MASKFEKTQNKKKKWPWIVAICVFAAVIAVLLVRCGGDPSGVPTLTVNPPQKLSVTNTEEITLDVTISNLGDVLYPAMSMSVSFDSSRLAFLGVEEGNIFILSDENSTGQQLPDWSCNVQNSNDTDLINIMYLDMTGGKNAFSKRMRCLLHPTKPRALP